MKELSTYYGLAIRRNIDSVENMRKEIWATFYHKISTDRKPQHSNCPAGANSWCDYRKLEAQKKLKGYKHPPPLADDVQQVLKPIYDDLTKQELLERCLGVHTQNNNEAFNHTVWHMAPKHIFSGKQVVEIATKTAACIFNEGFQPILRIFETMGCVLGPHSLNFARLHDEARIQRAEKQALSTTKETRMKNRNARSEEIELLEQAEGLIYGPGIDS